eukprot:4119177-Amphidinium_carterae.1
MIRPAFYYVFEGFHVARLPFSSALAAGWLRPGRPVKHVHFDNNKKTLAESAVFSGSLARKVNS